MVSGSELNTFYQGAEQGWPNSKFKTITATSPAPDTNGVIVAKQEDNVVIDGTSPEDLQIQLALSSLI